MKKLNWVTLKSEERKHLKRLVSQGKQKARSITRSRILLLSDEGKKDSEIIEALGITRNTVRTVRKRYVKEGLESAIHERARSGAPLKWSGKQRAKITALACSKPPQGRSRWTLRLLAERVVQLEIVKDISYMGIDRILKKTSLNLP